MFLGKSNFMDAISFVMGEKTNSLRVKRLGELIHGAAIGRPVSNRCSVTAKFDLDNGTQIEFQRSVINSSADYKINGKVNILNEPGDTQTKLIKFIVGREFKVLCIWNSLKVLV